MNQQEAILELMPRLHCAPLLGDKGLNTDNPTWEEAKYRICITLNGNFFTKQTSATLTQLTALIRQAEPMIGGRIYVDYTAQPETEEIDILRSKGLREVFGWGSFRTLDEFDAVLSSFSIHFELMSYSHILWGSGLQAFYSDRKNQRSGPVIIGGGVIATILEPLFGHPKGPLLDLVYIGEGEELLPKLVKALFDNDQLKKENREEFLWKLCSLIPNLYFPAKYVHHFGPLSEGNLAADPKFNLFDKACVDPQTPPYMLSRIEQTDARAPQHVHHHRSFDRHQPMFENRVLMITNDSAARGELQISHGCSGMGVCYFCAEGSEAGPWREFDDKAIVRNMDTLIKRAAPNVLSFYSFNTNYFSNIFDLYHEVAKKYSYISVIAFRADVVAAVPDYIKFLKALGVFRITVAVEGISERIRGPILNKNISEETILKTAEYVFREKFAMLKFNMIVTGFEEEADFAEFRALCDKLNALRIKCGAETSMVFSGTTLVTYPTVGLKWQPRKSVLWELLQVRAFRETVQYCRSLRMRWRFNSGPDFVLQQLLSDVGRRMTEPALEIYRRYWEANKPINSGGFFNEVADAVFQDIGLCNTDGTRNPEKLKEFFGRTRRFDELDQCSTLVVMTKKVEKMYQVNVGKRGTNYCLANPANQKPTCKTCEMCPTPEFTKERMVGRTFDSRHTVEDVQLAIFNNRPKSALRVVYKVRPDVISKHRFKVVANHKLAGLFCEVSEEIFKGFYALANYSDYISSAYDQPDCWTGVGMFDIQLRTDFTDLSNYLKEEGKDIFVTRAHHLVAMVNEKSPVLEVVNIYPVQVANLMKDLRCGWMFETQLPKVQLDQMRLGWNGKLKVMEKGNGPVVEVTEMDVDPKDIGLTLVQKGGKCYGFFALSGRHNPFLLLWSVFGLKIEKLKLLFNVSRVGMWNGQHFGCKACGAGAGFDLITGKASQVCPACSSKAKVLKLQA